MKKTNMAGIAMRFGLHKIFKIMRLTVFLILICVFQVFAENGFSQNTRLTLEYTNTSVENVLLKIEEQSRYVFLYNKDMIDVKRSVDVKFTDATVDNVMDAIFENTGVSYKIIGNQIALKPAIAIQSSNIKLSGKVTDTTGAPLPGVTVVVKGTTNGTITNFDGVYTLSDVSSDGIIQFSFVGMRMQEISVAGKQTINVEMKEDAIGIEEVVAIGYGTRKRETLTGSISTIDSKTFEDRPIASTISALQGTLPGLIVTQQSGQPGSQGFDLQLRGLSSINGGNSPLVLIDGLQSSFYTLNPDDIENISVLKDGAAAIYGNQAANGVILVTTKSGNRGAPKVSYNFTYGANTPSYFPEKFTHRQYMEVVNEGYLNDGSTALYGDIFFDALGTDQVLNFNQTRLGGALREDSYLVFNQSDDIFKDEFYDTGIRQNHNLSVEGGGINSTYRLSVGYLSEAGVLNTEFDNFKRYNIRLNNTVDITKNLKLSMQNSIEMGNQSQSTQLDNALQRVINGWTFQPMRRPDGVLYTFRGFENPVDLITQAGEYTNKNTTLLSNAKIEYNFLDGLKLTADAGIRKYTDRTKSEVPTIYLVNEWTTENPGSRTVSTTDPNRISEGTADVDYIRLDAYLSYTKQWNEKHNFSVTGGFSHEQEKCSTFGAEIRNLPTNDLFSLELGDLDEARVSAYNYDWTIRSFFGRANYTFNNKYIFDVNTRYDGSSRFDKDDRWGLFAGYAFAWRASEEEFIKSLDSFDNLKLRMSYGETGNQQGIGYYDYLSLINAGSTVILGSSSDLFGYQTENQTYVEGRVVSSERTWETIATTNFGIDVGIMDSKLNLSFDYFIKKNKDLLVNVEVPSVLGTSAPTLNKGTMETKGFELTLNWNDKIGDFNYYVIANLFNDVNKLTNLEGSKGVKSEGVNNRLVGYSTGTYFGYIYDGIIQNQNELDEYKSIITAGLPSGFGIGDARYVDVDGDGQLTSLGSDGQSGDLVELGNIRPQYSFGLTLGGNYKNFDFKVLIQGVGKRTLFKTGNFSAPIYKNYWFFQGLRAFYGNTWNAENTQAKYPELSVNSGVNDYNYHVSSNTKLNAAYARLKNVQIGYSFSKSILQKIGIEKLRLFVSGENIAELQSKESKDFGFDPESGTQSLGYPFLRTYSCGAQITF